LRNSTTHSIDATQTWWGDSDGSGPYHATTNPDGTGNQVSDNVVYAPWQTTVATEFSYVNFSAGSGSTYGSMPAPALTQGYLSDTWGTSPDRSMAWADENNSETVIVDYTGLDTEKRYKIRVSYFNGDPGGSIQSLADGNGVQVHGSMIMPTSSPVQYEFSIPTVSYNTDGNLTLKFVHDNPDTSIRVAVPEVWLMEDIPELTPPRFVGVEYNDADGSSTLTEGDEFYFHFSEEMDTSLIADGTTDANDRLVPEGDLIYGTVNQSRWNADNKTVIVTITAGFIVTGTEMVTTSGLVDLFGNTAIGSQTLSLTDTIAPEFTGLDLIDVDDSTSISLGDQYVFHFSETMDVSVIEDGTQDANVYMRPSGGLRYGDVNTINWSADGKDLTITITEGFTVLGDELVIPSSFVTDVAGNSVTGTQNLVGRDITPPEFVGIRFDDADASGTVTEGDRYFFGFNEPMRAASLSDNTTEGNENLPPEGKKYGNVNSISWNEDDTECVIRITVGFTVAGSEVVDPIDVVTDKAGNPVSNTGVLTLTDTIVPLLDSVEANYISPLSAVDNFRLTVQFDSAMDDAVQPVIEMISSGTPNPVVPDGGTWLTTFYTNDTYVTPDIVLSAGMDGDIQVNVSGAEDVAGNAMSLMVNAYEFLLDATPAVSPAVSLLSSNCDSALLLWEAYTPPDDLAGFEVYKKVGTSFTTIDGLSPVIWIDKTARTYEIGPLELNTSYYVAVVAVDTAGNKNATVVPVEIYISRSMPPQVSITVGPGDDPDSAIVSWHGYDTAGLCGFAGFRLYYEESDFSSVSGFTPKDAIDAAFREASVEGLDRTKTYYFAVVGFNDVDDFDPDVVTSAWSDPYAAEITEDTTIGDGEEKEIPVYETMVVTSGATLTIEPGTSLYFAPGTGIVVQSGALVIEGTALNPVIMTSENDREGMTPNPGDWNGITISAGGNGSILRHVFINYGQGLSLDGSAPTVEALTAKHNSVCGLRLLNGASLSTSDALVIYNQVGVQIEDSAQLTISNSVIKLNADYNAVAAGSNTMLAQENWWGATEAAGIVTLIDGTVDFDPFISYEPLLTPAIGTLNDETQVGAREVTLKLACRTAEEMRISEDSAFQDVFFDAFADTHFFTLSEGGGDKTVFAQFRSGTGAVSDPVSIQISYVTEGPVIQSFSVDEGQTISRPLMVTGKATAVLGMDVIEFYVDDVPVEQAYGTSFSYLWDVRGLENRIHRVKLLARDLAGNFAASEKNVVINVMPPPAPMITEPAGDIIVASKSLTVRGTAEPYITVRVTRNGTVVGTTTAGADGQFEVLDATLIEGSNEIMATALDDVGVSAQSNRVNVVMDSGPPAAQEMFEPSVVVGAGVVLEWKYAEIGERPASFRVYRNDSLFSDVAQATLVEDDYLSLTYMDSQVPDGTFYYAVLGVDEAGNISPLSNVVVIDYDSTSPSFGIVYDKIPPFGVGPVNITLTTTEKLFNTPTLTITPLGSNSPEVVGLTKVDDFTYTGTYDVAAETPSGKARVSVSGRDIVGNMFSGKPSGVDFVVDTQGPVGTIVTDADEPVQVLTDLDVNVTLSLSEFPKTGTTPILRFTPPEGGAVNIPLAGAETTWTVVLHLTPDMGSGNGRFTMEVQDDLGNVGTGFSAGEYLEIYNTDVPSATPAPVNLTAISRPGGEIDLSWSSVALAEAYRVYRADDDCITTPDVLVSDNLTNTSFKDIPSTDGNYCYGVTANRRGAESVMSDTVETVSDRVAPGAPENVAVSLGETGVIISWEPPGAGEMPDRYYIYRNGVKIRTISSVLSTTDHPTVGGGYDYSVASVDEVGNESLSDPVTFNLLVGAVASLQVLINNDDVPLLTWTSIDPSTVGYNVYRGGVKLNAVLLTEPSFEDVFYAGSSLMEYAVVAVNAGAEESPPRTVKVYPISFEAKSNPDEGGDSSPVVANYFNIIEVSVNNNEMAEAFTLERVELHITTDGDEQFAQESTVQKNIEPGKAYSDTVVVPVADTDEDHLLRITAVQQNESSVVIYQRHFLFEVERAGVMVEMSTDSLPLAGGYSTINLCVSNFGYADMDIVVNRANGAEPGDIYVAIENAEGLELSRGYYSGFPSGTKVAAGIGYVTLAHGETLCVDVQVLVPADLEEGTVLTFGGVVDKFAHDLTGIARESTAQLTGSMQSGITFSEYNGTAQTDKSAYANDEVVIISGQALNRDTDLPEPNVPLKIGFFTRGFHWFKEVTTDDDGNYTYEYNPTSGLSGKIVVWAAHPDVFDTLNQAVFSYHRMYTVPDTGDIRLSKADALAFTISLYNPGTTPLTGFALQFRAYTLDSQGNEIPESRLSGTATLPPDFEVGPGEKCEVELQLLAEIEAPDASNVEYTFTSAEGAAATFSGAVTLAEAIPVITVEQPVAGYVDVSVDRGDLATVPVTITNKGLRALETAELTLPANVTWMTINLPRNAEGKISLGDIEIGESRTFDMVFVPPDDQEFGYYQDTIVIGGANAQQDFNIHVLALVTSDQTGTVQFAVFNFLGQDIEDATIRLSNYAINEDIAPVNTDENGIAVITDLQEGEWSYQVVSAGHRSAQGTVAVVADQTVLEEVELIKSLVTIDFTVVPVPFTDQYEIVIEQTFVTNVPVPVLVVEPPYMNFDNVEPGFEVTVVAKVSNYGLIDLRDVSISSDYTESASSVPLISYLPRLHAMQSIDVPFRVTFWGNPDEVLPPGGSGGSGSEFDKCMKDCMLSDLYNMDKFKQGLANIIDGSSVSQFTKELAKIAVKLLLYIHEKKGKPSFKYSWLLDDVFKWIGCQIGCANRSGDWGKFQGEGTKPAQGPVYRASTSDGGAGCFMAGTPILMADGSRRSIETISVGDDVLSFDGNAGRVSQVYVQHSNHIRELRYQLLNRADAASGRPDAGTKMDLRRLKTTDEHLFWLRNSKGWVAARNLGIGDLLIMANGQEAEIVETTRFDTPVVVHTFDVDEYYSFFANGALIRQRCGGDREIGVEETLLNFLKAREDTGFTDYADVNRADITPGRGGR
jgi:fibronectin type 3 domain-containing protein